jgi:membrane fusion protein, heavy metal efflux system
MLVVRFSAECAPCALLFALFSAIGHGYSVLFRGPVLRSLGALLWLAFAFAPVCCKSKEEPTAKPQAKPEGVDVELTDKALAAAKLVIGKPQSTQRRSSVTATGSIDFVPSHVARIGPSIGGRIGSVLVTPGQRVKRGAVLLSLDSVDAGRARADVLSARSRLAQAEVEYDREKHLQSAGASSERAVTHAETERSVAKNEVGAAQARLATLGPGSATGGIALIAPIDGSVLELRARIGQPVGPTDTLVVLGDLDPVWLKVDIYERDFSRVHAGDEVRVSALAYPERAFFGKVDMLGTVVDPDRRVVEARIVLQNSDVALRPGMTATARIFGDPAAAAMRADGGPAPDQTVIAVPRRAVQTVDGQPFVFVEREHGKFEMRPVERGSDLEGQVEITRGLEGSENIVVDGGFILKSEYLKDQMGTND